MAATICRSAAGSPRAAGPGAAGPVAAVPAAGGWVGAGPRRRLQLVLAGIWLLDAILQFQSAMFTRAFAQMVAGSAAGNPALLARPIGWSADLIGQHVVAANAVFAGIQLALGLGIAWRPATRIALGASVAWALAVWWLGEGFGGILTGAAGPIDGAPGPAVLCALLAVLLWPSRRARPAAFAAGRAVGTRAARALWLLLWASLAYFALQPVVRAPRAISATVSGMAAGQPHWLAALGNCGAALLAGHGLLVSALLAAAFAVVAAGPYLPPRWSRGILAGAVGLAAIIWLGQGLGGILTGSGTDPDSAPLLALLALAYWPQPAPATAGDGMAQ
ncbi:MAG TPA: hypothetical protein VGI74_14340 [Streptosporangiaceae bacterium]